MGIQLEEQFLHNFRVHWEFIILVLQLRVLRPLLSFIRTEEQNKGITLLSLVCLVSEVAIIIK